ncbi:tyrosine-type recombinase/integrase [Polynucleobacter sp.]|uniref:tyrosine-type recombinase/integrase n=1 Tax=Polynucleobacter sp. TaxID=2029855 RepID=UPI0037C5B4BC
MEEGKKISFTARGLGSIISPGYHADPESKGLYIQVFKGVSSYKRSWIFRYTSPTLFTGREMGLGSLEARSLADARRKTLELRQLVMDGIDPTEDRCKDKSKRIAAINSGITFKEAAELCIEARKAEWKSSKHADQWRNTVATFAYPEIGKLRVDQINTRHIAKLLEQDIKKKNGEVEGTFWNVRTETATRVRQRIEVIFDWCKAHEYIKGDNPALLKGALGHLLPKAKKIQKKSHHPALPFQRIGEFVKDLREHNGYSALALELLILTATRTSEVIEAKWTEFNLDTKVWVIPAERMKAGKEHRVPLNARAIKILEHLRTISVSSYLFPGALHKEESHLSNMALLSMMRKMPKYSEYVPHGFRSTFRDWAAETTDYPNETVELALAHTIKNKAEAAYRRQDQLEKRCRLMDEWEEYINK